MPHDLAAGIPAHQLRISDRPQLAPPDVDLSEPTLFFLKLCAAHDDVSERELLTRLICQRCDAIGLQGLLDASGDIHAVPEFERANVKRMSG